MMAVIIATGFSGTTYPLTHGRVCWDWPRDGVPSATTSASGFPASGALPVRTDTAWRPTAIPATWTLAYPSTRNISFLGIAKHDLGTRGATIAIEYDVAGVWTAFAGADAIEPADDNPILLLAPVTACDGVRVRITASTGNPSLSIIMAGVADEWPRPFVWSGQPITEGDQIGFENTIALTGNWLGRSVVSDGLRFELTMANAPETWRQGAFKDFKAYANGEDAAFFIAARPDGYPQELSYAWATSVVTASRAISNKQASTAVTLSCQGLRPNVGG